jgi:hypothetical protein
MNEVQTCTGDPNLDANWKTVGMFSGGKATLNDFPPGTTVWVRDRTAGLRGIMGDWSVPVYLLDLDKGGLGLPPVVGEFKDNRGEFYDEEQYKGRAILVRYVSLNISPKSARMEQSFSPDGGKTWETNWICELTR